MSTPQTDQRELNTTELKAFIARDLAASNELATRITQLRQDISEGKPLPPKKIDLMERSNKDMTKDLLFRIEKIEEVGELTATDREMLQALNARLGVCDLQTMRLAELRDLESDARGERKREVLEAEKTTTEMHSSPQYEGEATHENIDSPVIEPREPDQDPSVKEDDAFTDENEVEEEEEEEENDDHEIDESTWPLLYRILGVDPSTPSEGIVSAVTKACKTLASKHNPKNLPNDAAAPARWEAITKAHDVLSDPDKRRFYDAHGKVPAGLEDFDLSQLR